jgi:hypothetical protein
MRAAIVAHGRVLHSAVEGHGGWLFKHSLPSTVERRRKVLGHDEFGPVVAVGAAQHPATVVLQARNQIDATRARQRPFRRANRHKWRGGGRRRAGSDPIPPG